MMKEYVYMVAYELQELEQDTAALEKVLLAYHAKKQKLLGNAWLVKTTETEEALYKKLSSFLHANDRCVVIRISRSHWAAQLPRILQKVTLWMAM